MAERGHSVLASANVRACVCLCADVASDRKCSPECFSHGLCYTVPKTGLGDGGSFVQDMNRDVSHLVVISDARRTMLLICQCNILQLTGKDIGYDAIFLKGCLFSASASAGLQPALNDCPNLLCPFILNRTRTTNLLDIIIEASAFESSPQGK